MSRLSLDEAAEDGTVRGGPDHSVAEGRERGDKTDEAGVRAPRNLSEKDFVSRSVKKNDKE